MVRRLRRDNYVSLSFDQHVVIGVFQFRKYDFVCLRISVRAVKTGIVRVYDDALFCRDIPSYGERLVSSLKIPSFCFFEGFLYFLFQARKVLSPSFHCFWPRGKSFVRYLSVWGRQQKPAKRTKISLVVIILFLMSWNRHSLAYP